MPTNPQDFPTSLFEFSRMFSTEEACLAYLYEVRWPEGFECPYCGTDAQPYRIESRHSVECSGCGRQISLTSGTVMERTHTELPIWFLAAFLQSTLKPGISALQFQRQAGLSRYETAYQILHKLRASTVRPHRGKLEGTIEVDETMIGGHKIGPRGRGAEGKALAVGAVEIVEGEKGAYSGRIRLLEIQDASHETLSAFLIENVEPGTVVRTDGWRGYLKGVKGLPAHSPCIRKSQSRFDRYASWRFIQAFTGLFERIRFQIQ